MIMCSLADIADMEDTRPDLSWRRDLDITLDWMRAR